VNARDILNIKVTFSHIMIGLLVIFSLMTILSYLSRYFLYFEPFTSLTVQYFVILLLILLCFTIKKKYFWSVIALVFAIANIIEIIPLYLNQSIANSNSTTIKVFHSNLHITNKDTERLIEYLNQNDPDIVLLEEVTDTWKVTIEKLRNRYPYGKAIFRDDCFGISLLSKIPIDDIKFIDFGNAEVPSVIAKFNYEKNNYTFIGTHLLPPTTPEYIRDRKRQVDKLSKYVYSQNRSIIIMGDLNMTSWSPLFKSLINTCKLVNTQLGYGIQPTWPIQVPPFWMPIDHCLVSNDLYVERRISGSNIGSDHYPILVELGHENG